MILLWVGALGGELIHQIINMLMSFMDPSAFFAAARQVGAGAAEEVMGTILNRRGSTGRRTLGLCAVISAYIHP